MDTLMFFGIYEDALERADEYCQDVLKNAGLENKIDSVFHEAHDKFYEFSWDRSVSITNALIFRAVFEIFHPETENFKILEIK